jgi:deoxyribonuclease-4
MRQRREYQEETANRLGNLAAEKDIVLSLHAPYYISLSSVDEEKRRNSINYILQAARAVKALGGNRIVVHPVPA